MKQLIARIDFVTAERGPISAMATDWRKESGRQKVQRRSTAHGMG